MDKQRIIKDLNEVINDIDLLDIEVTGEDVQNEMPKINQYDGTDFYRGYMYAWSKIPYAVRQAQKNKEEVEE